MPKGSQYERDVSKQLSLWWTNNGNDAVFWRTSGSGARATTRAKKGKLTKYEYGDISFTDPIGKPFIDCFLIEVKKGYTNEIDVLGLVDGKKKEPLLLKWWKKAELEKEFGDRSYSIVIFKRDSKKACVMFNEGLYDSLGMYDGIIDSYSLRIDAVVYSLYVCRLDDFLKVLTPKTVKRLLKIGG